MVARGICLCCFHGRLRVVWAPFKAAVAIDFLKTRTVLSNGRGGSRRLRALVGFLPVFFTVLWNNLPFHAFARLICTARYLLECLVQGQVMSNRVLPNCQHPRSQHQNKRESTHLPARVRMSVKRILVHDKFVNIAQRQLLFLSRENRLPYQIRIAKRRL